MEPSCQPDPENSNETAARYAGSPAPEVRVSDISSLCHYGNTQQTVTGALRQVLLSHFSDADNLLNHYLRRKLRASGPWIDEATRQASGDVSGILIEPLVNWTPEQSGQKPSLLLKSNSWNWERVSIGDQAGADVRTGTRYFSGYWIGSHTIFAAAKEGEEASLLATEVAKILLFYANDIREKLGLSRFSLVSIGEVAEVEEAADTYTVPVVVGYACAENWALIPDAPRLKRIIWRTKVVLNHY